MNRITIKTNKELRALPDVFDEPTVVEIESDERVVITENINNAKFVVRGHTEALAYRVSKVVATDRSLVSAAGNSEVSAHGESSVLGGDNSKIYAYDESSVSCWDNSKVEAYSSSRVRAFGNSDVELFDLSYGIILAPSVTIKKVMDYATCVCVDYIYDVIEKSDKCHLTAVPKKMIYGESCKA